MSEDTTKKCPLCGNEELVLMRTLNKKHCLDCDTVIPWYLEEDQDAVGYEKGNKNEPEE